MGEQGTKIMGGGEGSPALRNHQNKQTKESSAPDPDGRFVKALQQCHRNVLQDMS